MKGARDLNGHHPLRAQALGELACQRDRFGRARDDDLSGCVVVGHPDVALGAHAGCLGVVVGDAQQGSHGARGLFARPCHGFAPRHHEADPVLESERAARHQRGVLAEAVPGAGGRRQADPFHGVQDDETEHSRRQLRVLRLGQLLNGRLQEELGQIAVGGL